MEFIGIVYKLILPNDYFYVGSTTKGMKERMRCHKKDCYNEKQKQFNFNLYQHIRNNNIEFDQIKYEIIKEINLIENDIEELRIDENNEILKNRNDKCLNMRISHQTNEEYKEYKKQYRQDNKEEIKQYREDNKEKTKQYMKKYEEENNKSIICEICNRKFKNKNKYGHFKSKLHTEKIKIDNYGTINILN